MSNKPQHGTVKVLVTSIDGNLTHPFRADETVQAVRKFAYEHLVQDKAQVPFDATWMELAGARVENDVTLGSLLGSHQPGRDADLTLALAWTSQGGAR